MEAERVDHCHIAGIVKPHNHAVTIASFLCFLRETRAHLRCELVSQDQSDVVLIRDAVEEHYLDDQGKPAVYQSIESALYDDARAMVTLWPFFDRYDRDELQGFQRLVTLELEGLTGDRHPRKVFDRSPLGIAALVVGTVTIWMSIVRTLGGQRLDGLLELIRFNWVAGVIWVGGLFVVLWFILKTVRNNRHVALLSTISRALELYLDSHRPASGGPTVSRDA